MRLSVASKISVAIIGVLVLAVLSSIISIASAFRFEKIQRTLVADNLASVRAAEELEIALLEQRGYVSSYILDGGNTKWLEQLEQQRQDFEVWLGRARQTARSDHEREILDRLETVQREYARKRDEVVTLYETGNEDRATKILLNDVTSLYRSAYDACEQFITANQQLVEAAATDVRRQVEQITVVVVLTLLVTLLLGLALLWLFFQGVILPLRQISANVRSATGDKRQSVVDEQRDDMHELGHYVQRLMTNVEETRSDLEHSRIQLAHADKLVGVGKLAASVAHEIRNPLTSIKMWLYSLRRAVGQNLEIQQKFDIISDEIGRLESIVRNFLEFTRPPQLKLTPQSIDPIVDGTIRLVQHRLDEQGIVVERQDESDLPMALIDAEQLRQVFLNLLNNAIESMPTGGTLQVSCLRSNHGGREMMAVRVQDTGTGIPADVRGRIFEPFFSTKEDGTGLGLCISASVMARHNGLLELDSTNDQGTRWTVWIPVATIDTPSDRHFAPHVN